MVIKIEDMGEAVLARAASYLPPKGQELVREAFEFASERHAGQLRKSGDPAITHPLHAAETIANLQLDASTIAAALLHDVQEDCGVTNQEIAKRFGPEVAVMVEGVTKLGQISGQAAEARSGEQHTQAENLRKMFLAMAQDLRVVIIKLADRLHNMRTLWALKPEDQRRIAGETMEIYAPLAARLGIWDMKWQLEDLSFRYLQPDDYKFVAELIDAKRGARETYVSSGHGGLARGATEARHRGRDPGPRQAHLQHSPKDGEIRAPTARAWTRSTTCWRSGCWLRR